MKAILTASIGLLCAVLLVGVSPKASAQTNSVSFSRSELEWRAADLQVAVEALQRDARTSRQLSGNRIFEEQAARLLDTVQLLQRAVARDQTQLAAVGAALDDTIRAVQRVKAQLPRSGAGDVDRSWQALIDALAKFQGQYESIRSRIPSAAPERGDRGPGTNPVAERGTDAQLDAIVRALERCERLAERIVRTEDDRNLLRFLRERTQFIRAHLDTTLTGNELRRRELQRLTEDGTLVRAMLQRQPYDEQLGAAWREARSNLEALGQVNAR